MRYGVSKGGAADPIAMQLANLLLGNPADNPVIEVTLTGPTIEFQRAVSIAIVGAQFEMKLNDRQVDNDQILQISKGDTLAFGKLISGARAYIAFAATMQLSPVFNSYASHLIAGFGAISETAGNFGRAIQTDDVIHFEKLRIVAAGCLSGEYKLRYTPHPQIRVVAGTEERYFSRDAISDFYRQTYRVSAQSNRMGIRLCGGKLAAEHMPQIVSSGLCPGTIQIPADGKPIISFIEGQTIGGYPRIAHVISADLPLLGQLKANDRVSFVNISIAQAHKILAGKSQILDNLDMLTGTEN
jgi:antagonist of KipI